MALLREMFGRKVRELRTVCQRNHGQYATHGRTSNPTDRSARQTSTGCLQRPRGSSSQTARGNMIDGSRTLAALRDALLPNLISGELRVRGAKRFIGRTT